MTKSISRSVSGFVATAMMTGTAIAGQGPASQEVPATRPVAGLFGGAPRSDQNVRHRLTLNASLTEAQDDNVFDQRGSNAADPGLFPTRPYGALWGALGYQWQARSFNLNTSAESNYRWDQESAFVGLEHAAGVAFSGRVGRASRFSASQNVAGTTSYLSRLFPVPLGETEVTSPGSVAVVDASPGINYNATDQRLRTSDTAVGFEHPLTRRSAMSLASSIGFTDFSGPIPRSLRTYSFGAGVSRVMTRYARLRLNYSYRNAEYRESSDLSDQVVHDLDLGVDYGRPISPSRRTFVSFRTGSSLRANRHYDFIGEVMLNHQMARTWEAGLAYERGLQFVGAFVEPVFSDGLQATLHGLIARRVDVKTTVGVSMGEIGTASAEGLGNRFRTYSGVANGRYALTRFLALYGEYVYYFYDMDEGVRLISGIPFGLERHGARVGITLWAPLIRR